MEKTVLRIVLAVVVAVLVLALTSMGHALRYAVGLLVGLPSFVLIIIGRKQLGKSFAVMPEARALVTTGLYSTIQHPLYVFLDVFLAALIVVLGWPILLLPWGLLVVVHLLQMRREEKVLAAAFGADYETYTSHTWF
jgi:protein-S-isoprenylcysteine O-methyltransferase Ste14